MDMKSESLLIVGRSQSVLRKAKVETKFESETFKPAITHLKPVFTPWVKNRSLREQLDDPLQRDLIKIIEQGFPLVAQPYAEIGLQLVLTEQEVIERIENLQQSDLIKRIGVVVRHRRLGYQSNAMVVWDITDDQVVETGQCFGQFSFVTLCYQRPRRLPQWRYNLFTMIHGQDRENVMININQMAVHCGLEKTDYEILFSKRCFKQRGARYKSLNKK
jgi:DNA-binding Lrp family transcriptional regulator